ncbi:nuclear speckle splicing regulatory protein 1 [Leguminivora glycinivorella]|uniref:nuclear speckle splicing regulatory protein 1 n=1 Tax=Leguminivora glycinivorella TaxID=1035111 RepID=UPI00200F4ACC|nr:nuclear speckle splicing regulatory protein 1 [Leguminivora glycinivorella]
MSNKKYGLILPEKAKPNKPVFKATRNVFGNDSESDDDSNNKPVLLRPSDNINRQAKITQSKAIEEDPTIYQYDEIYDSMTIKKEEKKQKVKELKQPKYIENLLKTANKRKLENERRIERQVQKEREKEGDEFKDKEVFVTSAYKKKLEDLRLEEEKEQREEYLEKIGDVTKQRDLGGFYRHLYEQKLGSDKVLDKPAETKDSHADETFKNKRKPKTGDNEDVAKKRSYRKRKLSAENDGNLSEGEIVDSDDEINRVNLDDIRSAKKPKPVEDNIDADSDFSIDSSSEDADETNKTKGKKIKKNMEKNENVKNVNGKSDAPEERTPPKQVEVKETEVEAKTEVAPAPKPKIDIWKKRTVGEVFEQALKRYYERKAAKG